MEALSSTEIYLKDALNNIYEIPYYQREYRWEFKQLNELLNDLTEEFENHYQSNHTRSDGKNYGKYFLGSILVSEEKNIVDGQQRLTSVLLLLMYANNKLKVTNNNTYLPQYIVAEAYGEKTFMISNDERKKCLESLYESGCYQLDENEIDTVKNMYDRYEDIKEYFDEYSPQNHEKFLMFIEWLLNKVMFIKISARTEKDAHKTFTAMNDRGLNLTPVEMLKGQLLSEIKDKEQREEAERKWKNIINSLKQIEKGGDISFFKTWLRAHYAENGLENRTSIGDYERIGNELHKWISDNKNRLGLSNGSACFDFINYQVEIMSEIFIYLRNYAKNFNEDYQYVYYNSNRNITLQYQLILSSIKVSDEKSVRDKKIKAVSQFIDLWIIRKIFSGQQILYKSIEKEVFFLTKCIRGKNISDIINIFKSMLDKESLNCIDDYSYDSPNAYKHMSYILGRMTYYSEKQSGIIQTDIVKYLTRKGKYAYDVEHIFADNYYFNNANILFQFEKEFKKEREKFGALVLLPTSVNRSLQDKEYTYKLNKYVQENILASSLHQVTYSNNPGFLSFINSKKLRFSSYSTFNHESINERQQLYKMICYQIWGEDVLNIYYN